MNNRYLSSRGYSSSRVAMRSSGRALSLTVKTIFPWIPRRLSSSSRSSSVDLTSVIAQIWTHRTETTLCIRRKATTPYTSSTIRSRLTDSARTIYRVRSVTLTPSSRTRKFDCCTKSESRLFSRSSQSTSSAPFACTTRDPRDRLRRARAPMRTCGHLLIWLVYSRPCRMSTEIRMPTVTTSPSLPRSTASRTKSTSATSISRTFTMEISMRLSSSIR